MDAYPFDTDKVISLCRKYDANMIGMFGSMARGESTPTSDIDLLIAFSKPKSLLEIVRLERELSALLGRKVDLLTKDAISPYLRDKIMRELKVLYET